MRSGAAARAFGASRFRDFSETLVFQGVLKVLYTFLLLNIFVSQSGL
jgi:hypothetical protein